MERSYQKAGDCMITREYKLSPYFFNTLGI